MSEKYTRLSEKYNNEIDRLAENGFLDRLMSNALPNESEETDYNGWVEGAVAFMDENPDLLSKSQSLRAGG